MVVSGMDHIEKVIFHDLRFNFSGLRWGFINIGVFHGIKIPVSVGFEGGTWAGGNGGGGSSFSPALKKFYLSFFLRLSFCSSSAFLSRSSPAFCARRASSSICTICRCFWAATLCYSLFDPQAFLNSRRVLLSSLVICILSFNALRLRSSMRRLLITGLCVRYRPIFLRDHRN